MQLMMGFFALIDWIIYGLVSEMFSLIFLIAEVDIFKQETISMFTNRVYGVLGVIILFKIVISAIQYLISPDKMADKDKGMAGLLTRTIISIALLALVPQLFTFAKNAQVIISEAIPAIIIGREVGADDTEDIKEAGNWMAFQTLSTFVKPKAENLGNDEGINDMNSFLSNVTAGCGFFAPSECKYTYQFVFSIPVGIFMLYILISMGIDIAIRSIKMGILQLLAPIPIASYINNQDNFKAWYTTCFKVYADLFIRLIIIYFVVFLIGILANGGISLGDNMFVWIYMIIAILMFAKSAPKFISDALGLKGDGMGGIADMFKRNPLGTAKRLVDDTRAAYGNKMDKTAGSKLTTWQRRGAALKSALAAGKSSAWAGVKGAYNNKSHGEIVSGMKAAAQRNYDIRETMADKSVSHRAYYEQLRRNNIGYRQQAEQMNLEIEAASKASDKSKAVLDYVHNNMSQKFSPVQFSEDITNKMSKDSLLRSFSVGTGEYKISFNAADMKKGGTRTISGVMEDLKRISANQNGVYSGEEVSRAQGYLDRLQGISDSYVVSQTERLAKAISINDTDTIDDIKSYGFDGAVNPAFYNMIQDAKDAIGTYQNNTSYGRDTKAKGIDKGVLDVNGNVIDGMLGDWLKLNKSEGQIAQQQSKANADLSALAAKEIADRYNKKS